MNAIELHLLRSRRDRSNEIDRMLNGTVADMSPRHFDIFDILIWFGWALFGKRQPNEVNVARLVF